MRHARVLREAGYGVTLHSARHEARAALRAGGWAVADDLRALEDCRHAIVATRTLLHVENTISVLEAGMDVLVEKPLSISATHAAALIDKATAAERTVFCGLNLRFSQSLLCFREWLGRVGSVHAGHVECRSWLPDWRPGTDYRTCYSASAVDGGVLRDLIHEVDYAGWLLGWPASVFARFGRSGRLGIEAEEAACLSCPLPSGAGLNIALDYLSRIPTRIFRVFGEFGTLTWNGIAQTVTFESQGGATDHREIRESRDENLLRQDSAFLNDDASNLVRAAEALRALAVCDAARLSVDSGHDEVINYPKAA